MKCENVIQNRKGRYAIVKAELNGLVLYDAFEGNDRLFNQNMVRPSDKFWNEYAVV